MTPPTPPPKDPRLAPLPRASSPAAAAVAAEAVPDEMNPLDTGVHGVDEAPLQTIARRTKALTGAAYTQGRDVSALREDLRDYVKRDLDEHAEIRGEIRGMSEHVGGLRVTAEKTGATLETFVTMVKEERAAKKELGVEIKEDSKATRDFRRHLFIAFVGLVCTILGALVHWKLG